MRKLTAALASCMLIFPATARADAVNDALDAYALYQNDVSALMDVDVESGRTVDAALARISHDATPSVARGWVAYAALTAAQSPQFAASIQHNIREDGRATVLRQLREDPSYARRQQSGQAVQLILDVGNADDARANRVGDRYNQFAHTASRVQLVSSVLNVDLGPSRLSSSMFERLHVGALAGQPTRDASALGGRGFWDSLAGRDAHPSGPRGGRERPEYASATDHMLTLGALIVANATGSERDQVSDLLDEPLTKQCMLMERLQLRQCLSISTQASERAYCLGHHGLNGPGNCFSAMSR